MESNTFAPTARTLTFYTPDCLSMAATWHMADLSEMFIKYRIPGGEWITAAAAAEPGSGDYVYRAVMPGLTPGCIYEYVIVGGESITDIARFRVRDDAQKSVRFIYVTDSQEQEYPGRMFSQTLDSAITVHEPDFILHGGDIVNLGGSEEQWSKMLDSASHYLTSYPMMAAAGNHDYWDGYLFGNEHVTHRHFTINLPPQDTAHGMYYYFDCGPCRFVVLSSGDSVVTQGLCKSQRRWLCDTLSDCDAMWKIVVIHNPLYSPGKYGCRDPQNRPALVLRDQLNHIFGEYGVDLCLSGHDHIYSLSYPIDGNGEAQYDCIVEDGYFINPLGTVHMIGGCAGDQARESVLTEEKFILPLAEFHRVTPGTANYTAVTVCGDRLTLEYYTVADGIGRLTHRRGIIKR